MGSTIGFEMSLIIVEAIRGRCASFMSLPATVSEIFGGQTTPSILVGPHETTLCFHVVYHKGIFLCSAVASPLDRSKRFTLFALPDRPVHSETNAASPGSILAMQQLRAMTKSLTCPPLSMARYLFIQLGQQGRQWGERKCPIFDTRFNKI